MEKMRLNRPYLESLSTGELTAIALEEGIDVPGGLERVFIIEEILDLVLEDERTPGEEPFLTETVMPEPALLPRQYNITYLDVLIRDPLWVFAFWEIKAADRDSWENADNFGGYYLKVFPVDPMGKPVPVGSSLTTEGTDALSSPFTVSVGVNDTSWYLGFPPHARLSAAVRFQVELRCILGDADEVVAQAAPFRLPALLPPQGDWSGQSRLRVLSGLDDIPVLRNADRLSRAPRHPDQARE
jgi:hypothetical protein